MKLSREQLEELLELGGGAAYLADFDTFKANNCALLSALRRHYSNANLGYSYKTNHLPGFCIAAAGQGLYAEVVSGLEYELARKLGVPGNRIIFNGPVKSENEIATAIADQCIINIDNLTELSVVEDVLAERPNLSARLGLRCSLELPWKNRHTRFGLSDKNGDLLEAAERIRRLPNATLTGLHSHTSSGRALGAFKERAARMIELANKIFVDAPPQQINVGGGLCGPMPTFLQQQFGSETYTYEEFAEAIGGMFAQAFGEGVTELVLEPGVGVVGDAMFYACRVESIKQSHGRGFATTSGSLGHLKILPNEINQPLEVYPAPRRPSRTDDYPLDIVGFTCLEHDVLYHGFLGDLGPGDILLFSNVGAYSLVMATDFIRTSPPVFALDENGNCVIAKRKLSPEEFTARFVF